MDADDSHAPAAAAASATPLGLRLGDRVRARAIVADAHAGDDGGDHPPTDSGPALVEAHPQDLRARVVFASFRDTRPPPPLPLAAAAATASGADVGGYDRVLFARNAVPLRFPGRGASYPDSTGVGFDIGLADNVGTLAVHAAAPIAALQAFPACELRVFGGGGGPLEMGNREFLGRTAAVADAGASAYLRLPRRPTLLILEHDGALDLLHLRLFEDAASGAARAAAFRVFPVLLPSMKPLPYVHADGASVELVRRGGMHESAALLLACELARAFATTRTRATRAINLSVETQYAEEVGVHRAIVSNINAIFPALSAIERHALAHQAGVRARLDLLSAPPRFELPPQASLAPTVVVHSALVAGGAAEEDAAAALHFDGAPAPAAFHAIAGVRYVFEPYVPFAHADVPAPADDAPAGSVVFGARTRTPYGVVDEAGALSRVVGEVEAVAASEVPAFEDHHAVPAAFVHDASVSDVLGELTALAHAMPELSPSDTPNEGAVITHATFIHADGVERTCEACIFLPAQAVQISVYCSRAHERVPVYVTSQAAPVATVDVGALRLATTSVTTPLAEGVHALSTPFGSNVLFRVAAPCVAYAPVHPPFYASGQLQDDTRSSAAIDVVVQLDQLDVVAAAALDAAQQQRILVRSDAQLLSIPDVVFDVTTDFACAAAFFSRFGRTDATVAGVAGRESDVVWTHSLVGDAVLAHDEETPWRAVLDVRRGCALVPITPSHSRRFAMQSVMFHWCFQPAADAADAADAAGAAASAVPTVTLLQTPTHRLYVHDSELHMEEQQEQEQQEQQEQEQEQQALRVVVVRSSAGAGLVGGAWYHIAFTNGAFYVDGVQCQMLTTTTTMPTTAPTAADGDGPVPAADVLVVGTGARIDLSRPLHSPGAADAAVDVPWFCRARAREVRLLLECDSPVDALKTIDADAGTDVEWVRWTPPPAEATDAGAAPQQTFVVAAPDAASLPRRISALTVSSAARRAALVFHSAGCIRSVCSYAEPVPADVLSYASRNPDAVVDFARRRVVATCTNVEQHVVRTEVYAQRALALDPATGVSAAAPWLEAQRICSCYVTPPSLVMLSTSQQAPYSIRQSLLLLFNRRIEPFAKDDSTLFEIVGDDASQQLVRARDCTLLSTQIAVPNAALALAPGTTYAVRLAEGRLLQYEGRVPCIQCEVTFATEETVS